jgi:transposase-like protein
VSDAVCHLPHDYVALRTAQYRGLSPVIGELVSFSKALPIPISLTLTTLADQIEVETTAFAEPVAEKLGLDWDEIITPRKSTLRQYTDPKYAGPVVLQKAARLIGGATDILIKLPIWTYRLWGDNGWTEIEADGVSAALTLLDLHHATKAVLGLTRAVSVMQAKCPFCESYTLVRVAGDEFIHCQLCRRRFTDEEYQQWSLVVVNNHDPELLGKKINKIKAKRQARHPAEELHNTSEGTVGRPRREVG